MEIRESLKILKIRKMRILENMKSFKVVYFGINGKRLHDFLLVTGQAETDRKTEQNAQTSKK